MLARMDPAVLQAITLATAIVGAVLGVLNWWRAFNADRVRLQVRVSWAFVPGDSRPHISVNVVNLSNFAVTVTRLGFDLVGDARHIQLPGNIQTNGKPMPVRMEARTDLTALLPLAAVQDGNTRLRCAFAETACGQRRVGGKEALRHIQKPR